MQRKFDKKIQRVVIKIGASVITDSKGKLDERRLKSLAGQVSSLVYKGVDAVLVTSGAIATGIQLLGMRCRPNSLSCLQATAALGQNELMRMYFDAFKEHQKLCAQILLTWDDFNDRVRYLNAKNTLLQLLKYHVIPVINENDTVAVDEIKFGDNDKLSAMVASILEADLLIILSDVDGLYRIEGKDKEVIREVSDIEDIKDLAKDTTKKHTSVGGMKTKLEAARIAMNSGIPCVVADGKADDILSKILQQEDVGTIFIHRKGKLLAKKRWIAFGTKSKGKIYVDEGAKEALLHKGKSLLCPGIINTEGKFLANEVVLVADNKGEEFAKGLTNYSQAELQEIKGSRANKEVIHRDNLVILKGN
ncbi:MAG: glutamate 5-kinase [Candidatus Omnitrophota bacterium]|nr:glutamate 5-kinase [Candidatus Omnitrophota bacterium]